MLSMQWKIKAPNRGYRKVSNETQLRSSVRYVLSERPLGENELSLKPPSDYSTLVMGFGLSFRVRGETHGTGYRFLPGEEPGADELQFIARETSQGLSFLTIREDRIKEFVSGESTLNNQDLSFWGFRPGEGVRIGFPGNKELVLDIWDNRSSLLLESDKHNQSGEGNGSHFL